jgi:hypothetical protein
MFATKLGPTPSALKIGASKESSAGAVPRMLLTDNVTELEIPAPNGLRHNTTVDVVHVEVAQIGVPPI